MRELPAQALVAHTDRLYRAAWALCGSHEDAEDLVQETFMRVLARPRRLRGESEVAYLLTVLRNAFLSGRRTAGRRPQTAPMLEGSEFADPRSGSRPERAIEAVELFAAIARLPENFRFPLVAIDVMGLSYREAGSLLGVREATITTRLFRARERLAGDLDGEAAAALAPARVVGAREGGSL